MKKYLALIIFSWFCYSVSAEEIPQNPIQLPNKNKLVNKKEVVEDTTLLGKNPNSQPLSVFDHKHETWNQILKEYVLKTDSSTQFKYKKLKTQPETLNKYLTELSLVTQSEFDHWNEKQQMAFLINAYNAFTVKLILDHYPIESIKKIGGFFSNPWKKEFFTLLGKKRYLDWIEHEVLRKKFKEPRIHFAVNCASIGCPALRGEAYRADVLNEQLDEQTQLFLRDKSRNYIKNETLNVSKIFDWFEEDFTKDKSTVQSFVAPYITDNQQLQNRLKNGEFKVRYTNYDWNLNETP